MSKKQEAAKILSAKNLIDPVVYLIEFYEERTSLTPEEYYQFRYELAVRNKNDNQAKEALICYKIFKGNDS